MYSKLMAEKVAEMMADEPADIEHLLAAYLSGKTNRNEFTLLIELFAADMAVEVERQGKEHNGLLKCAGYED